MNKIKYTFSFLVHSRDISDVINAFPIAKILPNWLIKFLCRYWPPIKLYNISGLKCRKTEEEINGCVIGIPMTAEQMLGNRKAAYRRVIQACKLAEKYNAKIVGLGALTSVVTAGGKDLLGKVKIKISNGNALTSATTIKNIDYIIKNNRINSIAIVGATGSVGQVVCKILAEKYPKLKYLLFARTPSNLNNLIGALKISDKDIKILGYIQNIKEIKQADLIILTTSASEILITKEDLKQNAIIYDITQPKNISTEILLARNDVKIIDGGLMSIPKEIKNNFDMGYKKDVVFSCLAEIMVLAAEGKFENFSIGQVQKNKVFEIDRLAESNGIKPYLITN